METAWILAAASLSMLAAAPGFAQKLSDTEVKSLLPSAPMPNRPPPVFQPGQKLRAVILMARDADGVLVNLVQAGSPAD